MRATNIILLGSSNSDKIHEFKNLFNDYPHLELKSLHELVFNERALREAEVGKTYYENAFNKGRLCYIASKYPTISDDSGLEVDLLDGKPGILSARYAPAKPNQSQDSANMDKLLHEMHGVPKEKRTAKFVCTLVFFIEGVVLSATETLEGVILEAPRGKNGFGYDPLFLVKGTDKTLAEMTLEEKNKISHRHKALKSLMTQISEKGIKLVRP